MFIKLKMSLKLIGNHTRHSKLIVQSVSRKWQDQNFMTGNFIGNHLLLVQKNSKDKTSYTC